jgi:hypothetical protein
MSVSLVKSDSSIDGPFIGTLTYVVDVSEWSNESRIRLFRAFQDVAADMGLMPERVSKSDSTVMFDVSKMPGKWGSNLLDVLDNLCYGFDVWPEKRNIVLM